MAGEVQLNIHVRHILVDHKYEAEDILRKLQSGEDFAGLAKKFSKCPSASSGGDLGTVDSKRFVEEFAEAALKLRHNELSPVVRSKFGYHLIQKLD